MSGMEPRKAQALFTIQEVRGRIAGLKASRAREICRGIYANPAFDCRHRECFRWRSSGARSGVAVLPLFFADGDWAALLGKERAGDYKGKFNLCAGRMGGTDAGCWRWSAMRELSEEFKMDLSRAAVFDKSLRKRDGTVRCILFRGTPVYIPLFAWRRGLLARVNSTLERIKGDTDFPWCEREMEKVDLFNFDSSPRLGVGNPGASRLARVEVSSFASGVLRTVQAQKKELELVQVRTSALIEHK